MDTLTDVEVRQITDLMEALLVEPAPEPTVRVGSKVMPTTPPAPQAPAATCPVRPAPGPPPIIGRPAAQGDLLFLPSRRLMPHWTQPIIHVVDLVTEGNGHQLAPTGTVRYAAVNGGIHGSDHLVGLIDVAPGGTCRVQQPRGGADRHQPLTLGPGLWEIRRQTEQVAGGRVRITFD